MMLITLYFLTVSIVLTKRGVPQAATTGLMLPAQAVSAPA
jgi:hypothetical protein